MGPVYSRKVSSVRSRQAVGVGRQKGGAIFSTVKRRRRCLSKEKKGGTNLSRITICAWIQT